MRSENRSIRDWIPEEQPREILLRSGAQSLTPAKLLAIILRTGKKGVNAEELSRAVLNGFRGLRGIDSASIAELCGIKGIGRAKAAQIKAAFEIGKRLCRERASRRSRIGNARSAIRYVAGYYGPYLRDAQEELLCVILLDKRNVVLRAVEVCRGGPLSVAADPHQIVREAVSSRASTIIVVHNHPSGGGEPSQDDLSLTRAVRQVCQLFGISLLDHVVVGKNQEDYFSFARAGLL